MGNCTGGSCGWSNCSSSSAAGCGYSSSGCDTCTGNCKNSCDNTCKNFCLNGCNNQCDGEAQDTNIRLIQNLSKKILLKDIQNLILCLNHELARRGLTKISTSIFTSNDKIDYERLNNVLSTLNSVENQLDDINSVSKTQKIPISLRDNVKNKILKLYNQEIEVT